MSNYRLAMELRHGSPMSVGGIGDWLEAPLDWYYSREHGETGKVATRPSKVDFMAIRASQKVDMLKRFGPYRADDGSVLFFPNKRFQPVTSSENAESLIAFWEAMGADMEKQASGDRQLAISKVNQEFLRKVNDWRDAEYPHDGFKADALWDGILSWYARDLDNLSWAGLNIESGADRAKWALKESVKDLGKGVKNLLEKPWDFILRIGKWILIGVVTIVGVMFLYQIAKNR